MARSSVPSSSFSTNHRRMTRSMTKSAVGNKSNGDSDNNAHGSTHPKEVAMSKNNKVVAFYSEKMKKHRNNSFLPEVVIFNILVWLPADILYNVMRFVCRSWSDLIRDPEFIKEHLCRSAIGLVTQQLFHHFAFFLELVKGKERVARRKLNGRFPQSFKAGFDGLLLIQDKKHMMSFFHVVNPITKQHVTLAPLPPSVVGHRSALARAQSTGEYKVLHFYTSATIILTIGVDNAWRFINTDHLSGDARLFISCKPVSVLGFIYWFVHGSYLLALDVDSERIYIVPPPKDWQGRTKVCLKSESLLILGISDSRNVWDFWALMDSKTGKWRSLFIIDLESQVELLERVLSCKQYGPLTPRAVFENSDLVIFSSCGGIYIAYNVKTRKMFRYSKSESNSIYIDTHVNSLVVLKS